MAKFRGWPYSWPVRMIWNKPIVIAGAGKVFHVRGDCGYNAACFEYPIIVNGGNP